MGIAAGGFASVSGGFGKLALDDFTSITGGTGNAVGGRNTLVTGGQNVTDNIDNSIAPKPSFP